MGITAEQPPIESETIPIAVLEFSGSGLAAEELTGLTNRLRMELYKTGYYTIIERSMMTEILEEQGFQQTGCTDSECAVQLGQMLNVEKIIAGSVDKVGEVYATSIRLIDVESGKIDRIAADDCVNCSIGKVLIQSIGNVAIELTTGKETQEQLSDQAMAAIEQAPATTAPVVNQTASPETMERYLHNSIQHYDGARLPWRFKGRRIRSFSRVIRRLDRKNPHANQIVHHNKRIGLGVVLTTFVVTAPVGIPTMVINKRLRNKEINKYNRIVAQEHGIDPAQVQEI